MKFGTMTFLATLILTGVLTIPVRLAAQSSSSSEDTTFDAPGAGTAAGSGQGTFPESISDAGAITGRYIDAHNVNHGFLRSPVGDKLITFDAPLLALARPQVRDRGPFLTASTRRRLSQDTTLIRTM